jgi:hypothetical protein
MPVPKRSRNKNGRWRKKRSDAGKPRGLYNMKPKIKEEEDEEKDMELTTYE